MKKNMMCVLILAILAVATNAMADFNVKITIEDDILENRRVWAKPLAEFVVEGNELKPEHFDAHLFDAMKRGFTKRRTAHYPYRVDISFITDGEFSISSRLNNVKQLFSFLTKKKSPGDSLWYSGNGSPWTEVKLDVDGRAGVDNNTTSLRSANIFHTGGRVDLRFYTQPNDTRWVREGSTTPFSFKIYAKGNISPIQSNDELDEEKEGAAPGIHVDGYTQGYSESIQILRRWPDATNAMPEVEEEYAHKSTAGTPLIVRSNITAKDARPAMHVVKFGLKVEKPGIVQIGFIPHISNSRLLSDLEFKIWGSLTSIVYPKDVDTIFAAMVDEQYVPLKSWAVGADYWTSFYAKAPGIYTLAMYTPLTYVYLHTDNNVFPAGKMASLDGLMVFKVDDDKEFRIVGANDIVQVTEQVAQTDGIYVGRIPLEDMLLKSKIQ